MYRVTEWTGETMFSERPVQESHSKFCITNQKNEDLQEHPSNFGTRWLETTGFNLRKAAVAADNDIH
jgi:hypothetical protein